MKKTIKLIISALLFCLPAFAFAENSLIIGNYIAHYNALSTESLPPSVATAYGITRSANRGLLNISVLKKGSGFEGVEADIKVSATNLTGQLRNIDLRKIKEQAAVYYIGVFSVANEETLDFSIDVTTPEKQTGNIKMRQQFFTK
jgi:hypothetical protein